VSRWRRRPDQGHEEGAAGLRSSCGDAFREFEAFGSRSWARSEPATRKLARPRLSYPAGEILNKDSSKPLDVIDEC